MLLTKQGPASNNSLSSLRTLAFIFAPDNTVLLLKGGQSKTRWPGFYNGLGGHMKPGETPHQAITREIQEEAGLTLQEKLHLAGLITIIASTGPPSITLFIFSVQAKVKYKRLRATTEGTPEWKEWRKIAPEQMLPDLSDILTHLESGKFFWGRYSPTSEGTIERHYIYG